MNPQAALIKLGITSAVADHVADEVDHHGQWIGNATE